MGSSVHHGYSQLQIGDGEVVGASNRTHPSLINTQPFEAYVRTGRWANYALFGARIAFRRHSPLRPYVPNLRHRGALLDYAETFSRSWELAIYHSGSLGSGPDGTAGAVLTDRADGYGNFSRTFGRTYTMGNSSCAIGSMVVSYNAENFYMLGAAPNSQTGAWGEQALSEVDIPRNTIGNIFKHPYARTAWFNETLIVPLSQGQIQITGAYNPPEERLHHSGFQVYYAKNGGTGVIQGAVKITGFTDPGTPERFNDSTFAGFVLGDVGKYIAVHGRGIYLITAFVDASNVDTDAVTIGEGFTDGEGLTWSLRTGPIAEYFWRRRPYFKGNSWTNYIHGENNLLSFVAVDERLCYDKTEWNQIPQRTVYDGYGHWWWTTPNRVNKPYGIMRHLHMSPQPFQDVLNDGSITGLSQATWGATAAAPLGQWEDIIVDQNRKLWFSASSGQDDRYVLARMHPAPGGDASAPAVEAQWRKQQNAADASGLTSRAIVALCDDLSGVYSGPGTQRIWAIGGNNEPTTGGLNYSDDDGVTWKRVHQLSALTGTATPTNASTAVVGIGTTFTTQLAAGDWIRFTGDTRSYEIASITDNLNLVLAISYLGAGGAPVAIQKGALAANEAVLLTGYTLDYYATGFNSGQHNIDWDTNGNVYWISQGARICRWNPGDGACVSFAQASIPAVSPLTVVGTGAPVNFLKVVRVPAVAGSGVHPFHNEVWLGFTHNGSDTGDGWVRVRGDVAWTAAPTATNFTRYHQNPSIVTNFPSIVLVPKDGTSQYLPRSTSIVVEPTTGAIGLFSSYGEGTPSLHWLRMTGSESGTEYWRAEQTMIYSHGARASATVEPWRRMAYDELGMGMGCVVSGQDSNTFKPETEPPLTMHSAVWIDRRWNGSAWVKGMLAGNGWSDINFRSGSNSRTANAVLGAGLRRVHEWSQPLDDGMYISFLQAGGAVAQTDEFLADENSTFITYIGAGKDNTQTANLFYQFFVQPTVQRTCDEAVKTIKNMNTVDGGLEGGFSSSASGSLTFRPPFSRGVADYFKYPLGYGSAPGYLGTNALYLTSTVAMQPTAVLRIADELELDADGFWTAGTDLFNTSGGYVFTAGDVGKSIFIEGANGAAADDDNGQAVILARLSATQVQVDKVWFTTTRVAAAGRRWKLRNVPVVSFIEIGTYATDQDRMKIFWRHDMWSSKDHGVNWSLVKSSPKGTNAVPANGPDSASPGTWYTGYNGYKANPGISFHSNTSPAVGASVIFDLRDLPESVRRRQYWRWRTYEPDNIYNATSHFAGIHLYDENFKPLGRPIENRLDDADDDLFNGQQTDKIQVIRASGTGATPVDDGNADGLTNIVNVTGPLYTGTGVNNAQVTSAGRFIQPSASFTRLIIGNYIRIGGAANSANNGWALITGFVSATEVQTSKAFVNETNTFTWATCAFGPNDELRIDSVTAAPTRGQPLDDSYWTIIDVPSTTQILVLQAEVPHPITAAAWDVGREINRAQSTSPDPPVAPHDSFYTDWDTNNRVTIGHIEGTIHFGYDLEFVTVQSSTVSATTPADDDGDGCTDIVVLGEALTAVDGPVAGDFIEISNVTYGRRIFEIVSITGSDPNKVIKVKYDEILPGIASGLTWVIRRRRNLQQQVRRVTIVGSGAPVT